ncbi:zinc finger protein 675-like isoform X1 [Bradysia coprophila]|uniref:zinc finger protein 675-like isoform X1 n=1 Tax=Bradysia coprophila TaxID=38358 RepID=UPI00187DB591|nr:zinc finger protein 675-like isoform X1 [Bradysia coprophila]
MEKTNSKQQRHKNLQNCCRTCGNSTEELISIFDDEGLGYELDVKISTYLNLQVNRADKLPLNICIECTTTLLSFHNLYLCCLKAKDQYSDIVFTVESTDVSEIQRNSGNDVSKMHKDHGTGSPINKSCEIVDVSPPDQSNVDRNAETDNLQSCPAMSCQHCTEQFEKKEELIDHLRNEHTDLIFLCDVCKDYLPRSNLLEHMTSHALSLEAINSTSEEIKCERCDKTFPTDKKLQRHKKVAHQKPPKLFQCTECNKIFNTNRVLQNHYKHKHSDARRYHCDLCQKSFKTDSGLYAHRKTHADSYDYSCQICLKKFKFKVHLSRHLTVHTQEKNFFCRFCSKSFGVKDNLNKHLRTHYKMFEFKCHICEFLTSQQRYLTMHMKTSHLVKP